MDLARFDIANDHVDIFDASLDEVLDGVIYERAIADWEHGLLDDFGDRKAPGAPSCDWDNSFCNHNEVIISRDVL